jgi:tetratricopeptide (TPR) repeat protein
MTVPASSSTASSPAPSSDWDTRVTATWATLDACDPDDFVAAIERLAAERPAGDADALFERGGAQDSTGHPDRAVPLYQAALAAGVEGLRRRRATIQLASSLRNLGRVDEAVGLLREELAVPAERLDAPSAALDGAVRGFLALALADQGGEREGLALALEALAAVLPRYNRSLARYAQALRPMPSQPRHAADAP